MTANPLRLGAWLLLLTAALPAADPPFKQGEPFEGVARCQLSGQVEQDTARLKVKLTLVTDRPRVQVPIACDKAWATAATMPKECILLPAPPGQDGFVVQVEAPGTYEAIIDLDVPVTSRGIKGSERGFDLNLPRAAIGILEHLDLPPAVREVRIAGRPPMLAKELSSKRAKGPEKMGLPPMGLPPDRLEVTWRSPAPTQPDPLLASQAMIEVRVDDTYVTTEAELNLHLLRGQTAQWQVQLPPPPQATLEVDEPASDRVTITPPAADARLPLWTIQLKEPSAEPVKVRIRQMQARKQAVAIGPFAVPGAVRQQGTILISAAPSVRLRSPAKTRGAINPREPTDEQRRLPNLVAVYGYWSLPVAADSKQPVPAPLEFEVESVKGAVETSVTHTIRLGLGGWQVTTDIEVLPVRMEVKEIEVELPNYEVKASPAVLVEPDLEPRQAGERRLGVIKLARQQTQKFRITLDGLCDPRQMPMMLARPVGTIDAGGRVSVSVPEGKELVLARDSGVQTLSSDRREANWRSDRAPAQLELAWREHRAELPVEMVVDLTVTEWRVHARQHLRFRFENEPLKQVVLQAPEATKDPRSLNALLSRQDPAQPRWLATLAGPELTLEYDLAVPALTPGQRNRLLAVPIFWPDAATQVKTKVRVWSDPNLQPTLGGGSGGAWQELPLERVAERDALPVLVLHGNGIEKLNLLLTQPSVAPLPRIVVDRALIQATLGDGSYQTYRSRFLIQKISSRHLDIELPADPVSLNLEVFLAGQRVDTLKVIDEEGRDVELGHIVRLAVEPDLYRLPVTLEVRYQYRDSTGGWQTSFLPPRLRGNVFTGRVRWQLDLPSNRVVVAASGDLSPEQSWGLKGPLLGPKPAVSASEVERWFTGSKPSDEEALRSWELVAWQGDPRPATIYHASQQVWLLGCSLTVLALGLALSFAPLPRSLLWAILILIGLAVVAASILWPSTLAVVAYGVQPGILVLLLVVVLQWFFQRRYRRQVVFMPGFTRIAAGSSLVKHSSHHRTRGEPSTVDAPAGSLPEIGSRVGVPSGKS